MTVTVWLCVCQALSLRSSGKAGEALSVLEGGAALLQANESGGHRALLAVSHHTLATWLEGEGRADAALERLNRC